MGRRLQWGLVTDDEQEAAKRLAHSTTAAARGGAGAGCVTPCPGAPLASSHDRSSKLPRASLWLNHKLRGVEIRYGFYSVASCFVVFYQHEAERIRQTGGRHLEDGLAMVEIRTTGCLPTADRHDHCAGAARSRFWRRAVCAGVLC